jgi:hypothetical protein
MILLVARESPMESDETVTGQSHLYEKLQLRTSTLKAALSQYFFINKAH